MPARVEHEDRVLGDSLHQKAELLLAVVQRLAGGLVAGQQVLHLVERLAD
jgi:hypothetical protein